MNSSTDETVTLLDKITTALEIHNSILENHRGALAQFSKELSEMREKLEKVEAENSFSPTESKSLSSIVARLAAITNDLEKK